jgi:hypothetical protein
MTIVGARTDGLNGVRWPFPVWDPALGGLGTVCEASTGHGTGALSHALGKNWARLRV